MVTLRQATEIVPASRRTIQRWMTQGKVHIVKAPSGRPRICHNSLVGRSQRRTLLPLDPRIKRAVELIEQQYRDAHLRLDKLSRQVGLSVGSLSRLFKKETGVSFRQHVREVRMRKAEEMLRRTLLSIKEIAAEVGYKHVSDFDHHFKEVYGMTPREYREAGSTEAAEP